MQASLAPSTLSTYESGIRQFVQFCREVDRSPFPPSEDTLALFATSLRRRIAYKSIKTYLAAIQYKSITLGFCTRLTNMDILYYALRGIRRLQGNTFTRPPRIPFTLPLIRILHKRCAQIMASYKDVQMIKAASLLAFFGLLRASEYLAASQTRPKSEDTLCFQDLHFAKDSSWVTIYIKKSKTDPFRQGCTIKLWKQGKSLCPVHNLRYYRFLTGNQAGPLFRFSNGSFLTRQILSRLIHQCIPQADLNTHSFRIGGASAAHAAGIPDTTIQALGRWSSNAFRTYLRIPEDTVRNAQTRMRGATTRNQWHPEKEQWGENTDIAKKRRK